MKRPLVLIAAGGTGGHIYPALAIAHALQSERPDIQIEFVGTSAGLENKLIPREGFTLHHVPVGRLNRNARRGERIKTLIQLPWGLLKAAYLVFKLKPAFVLGVGGFVTGPVVLAAALLGRRAYLWEPNAHPGMANRWLAPFVDRCLVVFDAAAKTLRSKNIVKSGMPVRSLIEQIGGEITDRHGVRKPLRVLIFGGSQGARGINETVLKALQTGGAWAQDVEFVHQTGPADFERVRGLYQGVQAKIEVKDYLHDMDQRYRWADVVFARGGVGTISELAACGKAAVLIPLASAADNHQQVNAQVLLESDAAIMVLQKDFTPEKFQAQVNEFKSQPQIIDRLAANIRQFHRPRADREIARLLLEAVK